VAISPSIAEIADSLILQATEKHSTIYPCSNKSAFDECFTHDCDRLIFWYNTEDNSTHVLTKKV